MILGIDASNLRAGGAVTHLVQLLAAAEPGVPGFSQVVVWAGRAVRARIEERPWLLKQGEPLLERGLLHRTYWQYFRLSGLARQAGCDVLLVPGGSFAGDFQPTVTMSQTMLPFDKAERRRFGWSWMRVKLGILRVAQGRAFRRTDGLIFLTEYARNAVMNASRRKVGRTTIVPHGVDRRFVCPPREQLTLSQYSADRPLRLLYVSTIDMYKHQWHVVEAVARLRADGLPVTLDLVGAAYPPALRRLRQTLDRVDPRCEWVRYSGLVPYTELPRRYKEADVFVFASSCENMPITLLEGMASGLPIVCSCRGPMPEILGDAGLYCDPEIPGDIAETLRRVIELPELRAELAGASFARAKKYSWARCAQETFGFLASVAIGDRAVHVC